MSQSTQRVEYYWKDHRLVSREVYRLSKYSKWPKPGPIQDLVAIIDSHPNGMHVHNGPASTPTRLAHAVLRHERRESTLKVVTGPLHVPRELLNEISNKIDSEMEKLTRNFRQFTSEERHSGALTIAVNEFGIDYGGWSANVYMQGFSAIIKEPKTGADFGIISDLRTPDGNQVKALWGQAKRCVEIAPTFLNLKDFGDQIRGMQRYTDEAYGIVYTPEGVIVFRGLDEGERFSVGHLMSDMISCRRGDISAGLIANTLDRELLIEAFIRNRPRA